MTPDRGPPEAACAGKQGFPSAQIAHAVQRRHAAKGTPLDAYKCPHCRAWHLGATPLRPRPPRARRESVIGEDARGG